MSNVKSPRHCSDTAPTLLRHCSDTIPTLSRHPDTPTPVSTDTAPTLPRHCPDTAPTLPRHCPTLPRHCSTLRHSDTAGLKLVHPPIRIASRLEPSSLYPTGRRLTGYSQSEFFFNLCVQCCPRARAPHAYFAAPVRGRRAGHRTLTRAQVREPLTRRRRTASRPSPTSRTGRRAR
jgi:hypothetical protein